MMEGFRKQKEEMMSKKLAEQQREILKDMNKNEVDEILDKHKRQLRQMDDTLTHEQERQLKMMRERMAGKGKDVAKKKMLKQLKLAEIQKQKAIDMEKARQAQALQAQLA